MGIYGQNIVTEASELFVVDENQYMIGRPGLKIISENKKNPDSSKEEISEKARRLCEKVRRLCEKENVDFLFITEGKSCWSVSHNEHIREVAKFHKDTE